MVKSRRIIYEKEIKIIYESVLSNDGRKKDGKLEWVSVMDNFRLAYNPINLSYDSNAEGEKLRRMDEDRDIRRYVRARNMDDKGNSKYDLITGKQRVGIEQVIPENLGERYQHRLA